MCRYGEAVLPETSVREQSGHGATEARAEFDSRTPSALTLIVTAVRHDVGMALFTDRRTNVVHDIGMNAPPTHDPAQGLVGWASAARDARVGRAAVLTSLVPPSKDIPFRPNITSPAELRSRTSAWSSGSMPASQTVTPGQPLRRSSLSAQNALPSFLGRKMVSGPSFAKTRRR